MPTTITKTIKSAGGDYTSVTAWEAAVQGDLVTADQIQQGVIYDVNPTAVLTIDGSTTDATRYMTLTVDSAYRHAGKWDTAKQNFQASSTDAIIIINDDYTRISYVQVKNTHATNGGSAVKSSNTGCYAEQVVCVGTAGAFNHGVELASAATNCVLNNVVAHTCQNGISVGSGTGTVISNCTTVANRRAGLSSASSAALAVKNHYSGGNTSFNYVEGGSANIASWTFTTSMSSNTESTETGLTNSIAYTTANFTNVTAASEDLHLVSGSALIDQGTDLSGAFTVDIDGVTRTGTWDIGADEYVAAGGGAFPFRHHHPMAHMLVR